MGVRAIAAGLDRLFGKIAEQFERYLRRPGAAPVLIVSFWACAVLPNLTVRSFIYEEGTNAEIARDILAHGRLLQPFVYGVRWHEKPSLLAWLISGFAGVTGGVNEWSARLLMPRPSVADFARLRPDLDIRVVVEFVDRSPADGQPHRQAVKERDASAGAEAAGAVIARCSLRISAPNPPACARTRRSPRARKNRVRRSSPRARPTRAQGRCGSG